jgi:hypothetical protein
MRISLPSSFFKATAKAKEECAICHTKVMKVEQDMCKRCRIIVSKDICHLIDKDFYKLEGTEAQRNKAWELYTFGYGYLKDTYGNKTE